MSQRRRAGSVMAMDYADNCPARPGHVAEDHRRRRKTETALNSGAATATIIQLRDLVRSKNYVVSHRASNELEDDNLTVLDLEGIVLTGEIVERQRDPQTDETKHIVRGSTLDGYGAETFVKIGFTGTLIFITVYVV